MVPITVYVHTSENIIMMPIPDHHLSPNNKTPEPTDTTTEKNNSLSDQKEKR